MTPEPCNPGRDEAIDNSLLLQKITDTERAVESLEYKINKLLDHLGLDPIALEYGRSR